MEEPGKPGKSQRHVAAQRGPLSPVAAPTGTLTVRSLEVQSHLRDGKAVFTYLNDVYEANAEQAEDLSPFRTDSHRAATSSPSDALCH